MHKVISLLLFFMSFHLHAATPLQKVKADHLELNVYADQTSVQAGKSFYLALEFQMDPDWHIYWKNPGDSGTALKIDYQSAQSSFEKIDWPYPQRILLEPLTNYGYFPSVVLPVEIRVAENAQQEVLADMHLEWLVCKIECVPGFADIHLKLPVTATPVVDLQVEKIIQEALDKTPQKVEAKTQVLDWGGERYRFSLEVPGVQWDEVKEFQFYPVEKGIFVNSIPAAIQIQKNKIEVQLTFEPNLPKEIPPLHGLFVVKQMNDQVLSFEIPLPMQSAAYFLWKSLLFAFFGGMILNLMPCVFPVLSIKILSFLGEDKNRKKLRISGWFYTLGVLLAFALLSCVLLFFREAGESLGWGFQLQSPRFVFILAILFTVLAFNFLGFFEIGESFAGVGQKLQGRSDHLGSFFTGFLSTIVATPCTAPFMGSAIGASLSLPSYQAFFVFLAIGAGMALPFLVFSHYPQALKVLPKPGIWMLHLKEFFAFPMMITVIWLLWVLSLQKSASVLFYYLAAVVWISYWLWFRQKFAKVRWMGLLFLFNILLAAGIGSQAVEKMPLMAQETKADLWNKYSEAAVQEAIQNKQAVFIDFTASWCLTCQVNKKLVLHKDETLQIFKDQQVKLFEADWTNQDPEITRALQKLGRNALPVYVFYPADASGKPILLPEILTLATIKQLFPDNP